MTLNFQNRIVFPAPDTSYTTQSAHGQVIYIPRNLTAQINHKFNLLQNDENHLLQQNLQIQ